MNIKDLNNWNYPGPPLSEIIERAPREEISYLQSQGLVRQVKNCWEHNIFYRSRWERAGVDPAEIKSIADIHKLPIVTKGEIQQDLINNPPFGTFQGDISACRVQGSSGSTGMPKPFFFTRQDWDIAGNLWVRRLIGNGVTSEDRVQISLAYSLFLPGFNSTEGIMKIGAMAIPLGSGAATSTERQVVIAKDWGSTAILMTPSYALHFADAAEQLGYNIKKDFKLKRLILTGEPLPEALRGKIEDRWGLPAFDNYGNVECGGPPTFQCEGRIGMHINEDAFYFEVVDPETGEILPDGKEGLLVITTLYKQGSPLVRYNIGDFTSIHTEKCSCGRTFRRMSAVKARIDDMIKIRGVALYPTSVESVVRKSKDLASEYRIVIDSVENRDVLKLQAEVALTSTADCRDLEDKLSRELKVAIGLSFQVELLPFGTLSKEASADGRIKFKRVVDLRNQ